MTENSSIKYIYKFQFKNNTKSFQFEVDLNKNDLTLESPSASPPYPDWVKLEFCQCKICKLDKTKNVYCPVAVNILPIVNIFSEHISFEEVEVNVETEQREYKKTLPLQKGLSSLIGIYMVSSNCPTMKKLKPILKFHLPFATAEETKYRILSMYLLAQYFLFRRGKEPDWDLKNLISLYSEIKDVNTNLCKRLSNVVTEDAVSNAVILLNCFAETIIFSITKNVIKEIESLFTPYFEP
jgi:hypothetical protein